MTCSKPNVPGQKDEKVSMFRSPEGFSSRALSQRGSWASLIPARLCSKLGLQAQESARGALQSCDVPRAAECHSPSQGGCLNLSFHPDEAIVSAETTK